MNNFPPTILKSPFFWLAVLFMLTAKGHIEIIDTEYSIRTAKAIIEEGTMLIDPVSTGADHIPDIEGTNKQIFNSEEQLKELGINL